MNRCGTILGDKGSQVQILSSRPIESMSYKILYLEKWGNNVFGDSFGYTLSRLFSKASKFKYQALTADVAQLVEQLIRNH